MFEELQKAVLEGKEDMSLKMTKELLDKGEKPESIIKDGLIMGMSEVGKRFKAYEMYLPEVILSANTMKKSMEILKPMISEGDITSMGKVVTATIEGDLHDIGKNLVSMMLEGAGYEVIDLGVDISPNKIIEELSGNNTQLVGISAMLTTTMIALEPTIKEIHNKYPKTKVMVGGAPITEEYAKQIGADGFAPDALRAVDLAERLMQ